MKLGVCYYPEHWPEERWAIDARLMREAGLSLVRIGEFAWQKMEPAENQFDWAWLDRAIETLAAEGLKVLLCTPTAIPPAWLTHAHPEILMVDEQGRQRRFGSRRHVCANNAVLRRYNAHIVTEIARRYGKNTAVSGWQIDNEFGCHDTIRCYCERCAAAFRIWLQARYGTLDALNAAWGNAFWNQTYTDWEEIQPPNLTVTNPNPSHALDYNRFASDSWVTFQQEQIDLLRQYAPGQLITHNVMGNFADQDYYDEARELDFVGWDSYPTGYAEQQARDLYMPEDKRPAVAFDAGDPYVTGFCHDLTYGLKQKPFWVLEQQCGYVNWSTYNTLVRAGTPRLWTWHALACGAEGLLYFRWRSCLFAQEQYHSGLRNHDASPAIGYEDLLTMLPERELMEQIRQQPLQPQVALVLDYNEVWGLRLQPHRKNYDAMRHLFVYYQMLQRLGIPTAVVPPNADLSSFKVVIAPNTLLASAEQAAHLEAYAQAGGTLVLGVRAGFKTPTNLVTDQPLPGVFREMAGVQVKQWGSLPPEVRFNFQSDIEGLQGPAESWVEALQPTAASARSLATYTSGAYSGQSALTENMVGTGRVLYVGFYPTLAQAGALLTDLAQEEEIEMFGPLPEGVLATRRGRYILLLNFTESDQNVLINGTLVTIPSRQVKVLRD